MKGDQFRTEFLPLKTLRPYVFDEVCIADADIARVDDTEASRLPNVSQICSNLLARCESFAAVS